MTKFALTLIVLLKFLAFNVSASEIEIKYKVGKYIITNFDIEKEIKYLTALNNKLSELENRQILDIATESLIREKIKYIELKKYYEFEGKNDYLTKIYFDLKNRLNLNNEIELNEYFKRFDLNQNEIMFKIEIETLWNQLIFQKYNSLVKIDETNLKKKLIKRKKNLKKKQLNISEIVFQQNSGKEINKTIKEIQKSIKDVGFESTANIFSIADSKSFGGNVGWVDEDNLSEQIISKIKNLNEKEISEPINIGSNYIILKVNQIRENAENINENEELKKIEMFERDKQLNKFSMIYYNKIKINTNVKKL